MKKIGLMCVILGIVNGVHAMQDLYCVILAGGNGERLWPLSRQDYPKQFLSVVGQESLLDQAIARVVPIVPREHIWVSTTEHHAPKIKALVGDKIGRIVVEPGSRNTGPAILLSCFEIYKQNPDAVVVFVPADPFIPEKDSAKFVHFLEHAIDFVRTKNRISLLGVEPTYAATGYGYIEFDRQSSPLAPYVVSKFHEKPNPETAQRYCDAGNMLWNIGMFCGRVSLFMQEFKVHARDMYDGVIAYLAGVIPYADVISDSVDYAIMEKSERVSVLPVDFSWCDVGNLEIFLTLKAQCKSLPENVITIEAQNNLVDVPDQLVALVGVDDLCVVKTGDVLLITKRREAEQVKKVVQTLKRRQDNSYL